MAVVATPATTIVAAAVVPTMTITGLTGATVGAAATDSDLHARTAVAVTLATIIVAVATPVTTTEAAVVATPVTTIAAAAAATPATTATVEVTTDAD